MLEMTFWFSPMRLIRLFLLLSARTANSSCVQLVSVPPPSSRLWLCLFKLDLGSGLSIWSPVLTVPDEEGRCWTAGKASFVVVSPSPLADVSPSCPTVISGVVGGWGEVDGDSEAVFIGVDSDDELGEVF